MAAMLREMWGQEREEETGRRRSGWSARCACRASTLRCAPPRFSQLSAVAPNASAQRCRAISCGACAHVCAHT
eukprot:2161185-Rhodomonas_salina.1